MNGKETTQFLTEYGFGAVIFGSALALAGASATAVAGICIGVYGWIISRYNKNNSGVTFLFPWTSLAMLKPIPAIKDNY